ncbi:MAG: TetR/AcrR family transcriptional regulator [Alphaproteobacteria bacterium]|nr:TetR/AcrR family transcriptional regulator [Alphaproteobacteria bacterium]
MARDTRAKIVEKAEKLLWQRGYEATSLNDLVDGAGVSKGAFFHYYPSKHAISQEIIGKYATERLSAPLQKALAGNTSIKAGLRVWLAEMFETCKRSDFRGGCLLGNLALELSDQNDHARATIAQHFLDLENMLVSALRPLAAAGQLAMEPRACARLFIAAYQGVMMSVKIHKDHNRASREFQALAALSDQLIQD